MNIQEAITKAVEEGWNAELSTPEHKKFPRTHIQGIDLEGQEQTLCLWQVVCDPLFWQALGKAMGWDEKSGWGFEEWRHKQTSLISHLQDGGTIESFFKEL